MLRWHLWMKLLLEDSIFIYIYLFRPSCFFLYQVATILSSSCPIWRISYRIPSTLLIEQECANVTRMPSPPCDVYALWILLVNSLCKWVSQLKQIVLFYSTILGLQKKKMIVTIYSRIAAERTTVRPGNNNYSLYKDALKASNSIAEK